MSWVYDVDHPAAFEHEGYTALVLDDGDSDTRCINHAMHSDTRRINHAMHSDTRWCSRAGVLAGPEQARPFLDTGRPERVWWQVKGRRSRSRSDAGRRP